jgi:hypothetical protein
LKLREKLKTVEQENEELKKKLGKFEAARTRASRRKPKRRWKKLRRPAGHPGVTRPTPEVIHHVVEETLETQPLYFWTKIRSF